MGDTEEKVDAGQPSEPVLPKATAPPAEPDAKTGEEWLALYKTLFGTYSGMKGYAEQQATRANTEAAEKSALAQEKKALEQKLAALEVQVTTSNQSVQQTLDALKAQNAQLVSENTTLKRGKEISKIIESEFSALAPIYAKNLLIGVEGMADDELRTYLKNYQETLQGVKSEQKHQENSGAAPPPPPGDKSQTSITIDQAMKALDQATRDHGIRSKEYQDALRVYQDLIMQPTQSLATNRRSVLPKA